MKMLLITGFILSLSGSSFAKDDKGLKPCESGSAAEILKKIEKGECLETYHDPSAPSFAKKHGIKTHFVDERVSGNSAADTDMWNSSKKRQIEEDAKEHKDAATGLFQPKPVVGAGIESK